MPTLYEIVTQAQIIEQQIIECEGEIGPELEAALSGFDLTLSEKVEGYGQMMDHVENASEYWKKKAQEYTRLARGLEAVVSRIKGHLKNGMILLRKDEVFGESIRFKLSTTKGTLVIEDPSKIPPQFTMTVTTQVPDKEKIRAALEALDDVPGARLEGGYSLRRYANRSTK